MSGNTTMCVYTNRLQVAKIIGAVITYVHQDHLGSTRLKTDASGNPVYSSNYQPFGVGEDKAGSEEFRYTGKPSDDVTGLYYFRARYYDPSIGRFIAEDPLSGASWIRRALTGTCTAGTTHTSTQTQTDTG
jgi:RHS repeat-associated protein